MTTELEKRLCYCVRPVDEESLPLFVISVPNQECNYDSVLDNILKMIDRETSGEDTRMQYELLVFCAGGKYRPSWPWLIQAFSKIDRRYKKALQKLYLVHEKSWVRVCLQLLENVVSPKFARKVRHVKTLDDLHSLLGDTMTTIQIPSEVQRYDDQFTREEKRPRRGRHLKGKINRGDSPVSDMFGRTSEKRALSPPEPPVSRAQSRGSQIMHKASSKSRVPASAPSIPPRRTTNTHTKRDCIIFEDPEDESTAAERAAVHLENLLREASPDRTHGHRSSSAPTIVQPSMPPLSNQPPQKLRGATTLRRAISGPLTPSSAVKQNYIPTDKSMPPPKIRIHGREVTVKTKKVMKENASKVGGLAALFEERALVARSMS